MNWKAIIPIALVGVIAIVILWIIRPTPVLTPDKGERERDSLRIEELLKSRLAQQKVDWADSVARFADTIEAHMLPPETLYIRNHEKALSADVAHMRWFMGQRPRDTSATR